MVPYCLWIFSSIRATDPLTTTQSFGEQTIGGTPWMNFRISGFDIGRSGNLQAGTFSLRKKKQNITHLKKKTVSRTKRKIFLTSCLFAARRLRQIFLPTEDNFISDKRKKRQENYISCRKNIIFLLHKNVCTNKFWKFSKIRNSPCDLGMLIRISDQIGQLETKNIR